MKYLLLLLLTTQAWAQVIAPPFGTWEVREYGANGQVLTVTSTTGTNDTIEKTAGTANSLSGQVEALAISSESVISGDTSVEFTVDGTTDRVLVGLTAQDPPASGPVELSRTTDINPTIDFGLWTLNTSVYLVNRTNTNGLLISGLSITTGDKLKIGTVGTDIKVYKNGTEFCTLGIAPCNTGNSLTINYPMKVVGYFLNVGYSASSINFLGAAAPPVSGPAAGEFVAFNPYAVAPDAITTKGGLLTSNGTNQVVKAACDNTEIIEFDSTVAEGFKCVAKPVDTNAGTLCAAGQYLDGDGTCKAVPSGGGAPTPVGTYLLDSSIFSGTLAAPVVSVASGSKVRVYLSQNANGRAVTNIGDGGCLTYPSANSTGNYVSCSSRSQFGFFDQISYFNAGAGATTGLCTRTSLSFGALPITVNSEVVAGHAGTASSHVGLVGSSTGDDWCVIGTAFNCNGETVLEDTDLDGSITVTIGATQAESTGIRCYVHVEQL